MSRYVNQLHIAQEAGPTVRPLQGLPANKHGSSWSMNQFDPKRTLVDVRSETNDAEMLCASIGVVATANAQGFLIAGGNADLTATITWGIGGANFEAEIDLVAGLTFCIPANFLRIDVSYGGDAPLAPNPAPTYQISAGVGYGTYSPVSSPTRRTFRLGSLIVGASAFIPIPPFATAFTLFKEDAVTADPLQAFVVSSGAGAGIAYEYANQSNGATQIENTYPIANGSTSLLVLNPLGNPDPITAGVIFTLSL